jgi:L-ascorbate metabolism protein UlaG (beta-lactamase superfamily)
MAIGGGATFTWHGHSCLEVRSGSGKTLLIDPWFGNPRSPGAADQVDRCDLLLVTHGHFDHFGDALAIARRTAPTWVANHEMSLWVGTQWAEGGERIVGMNTGGTVDVDGIKVSMVPAVHSGSDTTPTPGGPSADVPIYLGEPNGFVVELEDGFRFYHSGDTTAFGDLLLIGELYSPEIAFLPIGGHYTMGPREAALAIELLGVKRVVPIHWGTFPILAGTPAQLREELGTRGVEGVEVVDMEPGEPLDAAG